MRPIRVLIVDDHALFAEALGTRLAREPDLMPLPVAAGPRQAIALLRTERPDVLVLDLMLGADSGLDLLDEVRRTHPHVRVVVLTADTADAGRIADAVRRGAVGWVPKTEGADLVARVVRAAAGRGGWIPAEVLGDVLRTLTGDAPGPGAGGPLGGLTPREREVLQCLVDGASRAQVAARLGLSCNTVRTHTQNLLAKLELHSTLEAVTLAMRSGLRPSGTGDLHSHK